MRVASLLLLIVALDCHGAPSQVRVEVGKVPLRPPAYATIAFATQGPAYGPFDQAVRGRYHRLVVLNAPVVYDPPTLRIETITYGDEGCCHRLVSARELPLEQLSEVGIKLPDPPYSEFRFLRWVGPQSAEFKYGSLTCRLSSLSRSQLVVACGE